MRFHWVQWPESLCPVHRSPWWTKRPTGGYVEHPSLDHALAWCRMEEHRGWVVVEAVTLRVLARPEPLAVQLALFEEVGR